MPTTEVVRPRAAEVESAHLDLAHFFFCFAGDFSILMDTAIFLVEFYSSVVQECQHAQ